MADEISVINDGLIWLYHNKYVSKQLRKYDINKPEILFCNSAEFDHIFSIIRKVGK